MAPKVGLGTEGPVQRGWALWIASVVGVLLAALFVGARCLQRYFNSGLGWDDYTILISLVASGLLSMTECQAVVYGYGRHAAQLPKASVITARKWFYGAQIMYKLVVMLNKMSIVFLYYRIFAVSKGGFRVACHIAQAIIVASGLAFIIGTIFQCHPIAAFWDKKIPNGICFKNQPWWMWYSMVQIITDVGLLALPVRQVMTLSMSRTEKLGLCLVFCTGFFVTFASIFRATTLAASAHDTDPTWGPIPATVWAVIEANAGIICACLPMLRSPFLRLFGPLFGSNRTRNNSSRYGVKNSYKLSNRSDRTNGLGLGRSRGVRKLGKADVTIDIEESGSEERIIGLGGRGSREVMDGGAGEGVSQQAGAGIMVSNEYTVSRSMTADEKNEKAVVQEDREKLQLSENGEGKESVRNTFQYV